MIATSGPYLETYHSPLVADGWCHILQALSYPAYLRCLPELYLCRVILAAVSAVGHDVELPIGLPPEWHAVLFAPTASYRIAIDDAGVALSIAPADPSDRRPNDLTEADPIEKDASIFQYKVECGGDGTADGYAEWLRERGCYTITFRFLARAFGSQGTYFALPALVRASFSTSAPIMAFASRVEFLAKHRRTLPLLNLSHPPAIDGFHELLDNRPLRSDLCTR